MNEDFIRKYDVIHTSIDMDNPLTIGNGNFAFTCDITGLQTFYKDYTKFPLCTMSNYHWGRKKINGQPPYKEYQKASDGSPVLYMTDTLAKNYSLYRDDAFKFDIFKLVLCDQEKIIDSSYLSNIHQHLFLYEAKIISSFNYKNQLVWIETKIPQSHNTLIVKIKTNYQGLSIRCLFLKPNSSIQGGSDLDSNFIVDDARIYRDEETVSYALFYKTNMVREGLSFSVEKNSILEISLDNDFQDDNDMQNYFEMAKFIDTEDEEINRRLVLSLYLMKVNTLGIYPPAETGLSCNSWYGKFHLEMHLWHHLGLIRLGLYQFVLPSLRWYQTIFESSKKRAKEQGYQGIRFPKMTDYRGIDTPSNIGCLLVWQMPHLILMLDEIIKQDDLAINIVEWLPLTKGLIDFMVSFFYLKEGKYHLDSPLIPANENIAYYCDTPIFEECYMIHAFKIFKNWIEKYQLSYDTAKLDDIIKNYVPLEIRNKCYEAYIGCSSTYSEYNYDHPMMVGMFSFFKSRIVDPEIIKNTLHKIVECWNFDQAWGWDFPMLAMVANNIGDRKLALQILKMKANKNCYIKSGHNPQVPREDLPIYLPGNGAFLLAVSHIFK